MKTYSFTLYIASSTNKPHPEPQTFTYKAKSKFLAYCKLREDKTAKKFHIPQFNLI